MLDNHYVPDGYGIIPSFNILGYEISSYTLFVGLGLLIGIFFFFLTVTSVEKVNKENACYIVLSALIFGFVGSKILVIIENLETILKDFESLKGLIINGKSIIGGLIGGYLGVKFIKRKLKIENIRTGNNVAPSIALGMAIGRIGCFLTGCCFGVETNLPIGIDFGDGITRIPTQLIEMLFCFMLFAYLLYKQKRKKDLIPGILFKELVLFYFIFRFFIEFVRGTNKFLLYFSVYQVICLIGIIYIMKKIKKEKMIENKIICV